MSTQSDERVPDLTLGWRLKMALSHADISRQTMAEHLGVDPATVSRWCAERGAAPKRVYLLQWAVATGVPIEWLENGAFGGGPGGGGPVTARFPTIAAA